jgi:streptogramin lyase
VASTLVAFTAAHRKTSGEPAPDRINQSPDLVQPEGVVFDKHKNLWVTNCSDPVNDAGSVVEFTQAQLRGLKNNPAPLPANSLLDDGALGVFDCPYGSEFDKNGNLWITNRFTPNLISFRPDELQLGGIQIPDTEIFFGGFGDPEDLQFDSAGTLWIADVSAGSIFGYKAASLAAFIGTIGFLSPDIINSSAALNGPDAIAFDRAGNQWIANCTGDNVLKFNAADIAASGTPAPAVTLSGTSVTTAGGTANSLDCPEGITFDKDGSLWVSNAVSDNNGSLAKFTPDQLTATGSPAPAVFLDSDAGGTNLSQPVLIDFGPP